VWGALAEDLPEIAELDLNPVLVGVDGAQVVDARTRVEPRDPAPPEGAAPAPAAVSRGLVCRHSCLWPGG
jgi:ATP-grasp domain